MATKFKSLREFLFPSKKVSIKIPNYQRGYKWGVKDSSSKDSSAEYLTKSLMEAWDPDPKNWQTFFLQGITVVEDGDEVVLVDGQQRITTLYLMLRVLDYDVSNIKLQYEVRPDSQGFLSNLAKQKEPFKLEIARSDIRDTQDIRYFKEAMSQMFKLLATKVTIKADNRLPFIDFLMDYVAFLYVVVDKEQAVNTFSLMNGNKATMHQEELVKAQLLHMASSLCGQYEKTQPMNMDEAFEEMKQFVAVEWECDALRSRYAREWDKWLYWWNHEEVKNFFGSGRQPMGILLRFYVWELNPKELSKADVSVFSFDKVKEHLQRENATKTFSELRKLQKKFEDAYNLPIVHNHLKLALICANDEMDRFDVLEYFFNNLTRIDELKRYALWRLTGATHKSIVSEPTLNDEGKCKEDYAREAYLRLSKNIVYNAEGMEDAYRQLLRLNVEEYDKLNEGKGVAFDFSVWRDRSLEHVCPKSRFVHQEERDGKKIYVRGDGKIVPAADVDRLLNRAEYFKRDGKVDGSEHCIGNLVLLYKDNNSRFNDSCFESKKQIYFDAGSDFKFASRGLLHSISVFAESKWEADEIRKHRDQFLERFRKDYGLAENDIKEDAK